MENISMKIMPRRQGKVANFIIFCNSQNHEKCRFVVHRIFKHILKYIFCTKLRRGSCFSIRRKESIVPRSCLSHPHPAYIADTTILLVSVILIISLEPEKCFPSHVGLPYSAPE